MRVRTIASLTILCLSTCLAAGNESAKETKMSTAVGQSRTCAQAKITATEFGLSTESGTAFRPCEPHAPKTVLGFGSALSAGSFPLPQQISRGMPLVSFAAQSFHISGQRRSASFCNPSSHDRSRIETANRVTTQSTIRPHSPGIRYESRIVTRVPVAVRPTPHPCVPRTPYESSNCHSSTFSHSYALIVASSAISGPFNVPVMRSFCPARNSEAPPWI